MSKGMGLKANVTYVMYDEIIMTCPTEQMLLLQVFKLMVGLEASEYLHFSLWLW